MRAWRGWRKANVKEDEITKAEADRLEGFLQQKAPWER